MIKMVLKVEADSCRETESLWLGQGWVYLFVLIYFDIMLIEKCRNVFGACEYIRH